MKKNAKFMAVLLAASGVLAFATRKNMIVRKK